MEIAILVALAGLVVLAVFYPTKESDGRDPWPWERLRLSRASDAVSHAELVNFFLEGCYFFTGGLGSGKSYISTRWGLILASKLGIPFRANFPVDEQKARLALASVGLPCPKIEMFSLHDDYDRSPAVVVMDEWDYYMSEERALKKRIVGVVRMARKRGQIVFILNQVPLNWKEMKVFRYVIQCRFWTWTKTFRPSVKDPKVRNQWSKQAVLRTFTVPLSKWFAKAYDSWYDFAAVEEDDQAVAAEARAERRNAGGTRAPRGGGPRVRRSARYNCPNEKRRPRGRPFCPDNRSLAPRDSLGKRS